MMSTSPKMLDQEPNGEDEIEGSLQDIVASMRMEGFDMPDHVIEKVRAVMKGELDGEEEIARIIAPHLSALNDKKANTH